MPSHPDTARCPRCALVLQKLRTRGAPVPLTDGSTVVRAVCGRPGCRAELVVRQPPCALGPPEVSLLAHFVTRLDARAHAVRRVTGALVAACVLAAPTVSAARCFHSMSAYDASLVWLPVPLVTLLSGLALALLAVAALTDESRDRARLLELVAGVCPEVLAPTRPQRAPAPHPYRVAEISGSERLGAPGQPAGILSSTPPSKVG